MFPSVTCPSFSRQFSRPCSFSLKVITQLHKTLSMCLIYAQSQNSQRTVSFLEITIGFQTSSLSTEPNTTGCVADVLVKCWSYSCSDLISSNMSLCWDSYTKTGPGRRKYYTALALRMNTNSFTSCGHPL